MNYTGLFECICAISEEELYKAPLPDEGESVCLSSAQFSQGQVPPRTALTGSLVKDAENKVVVFSAICKNFSEGQILDPASSLCKTAFKQRISTGMGKLSKALRLQVHCRLCSHCSLLQRREPKK